jgi:predicted dienelactone hydrolase
MKYQIVITPETFHHFGKHDLEHICPPIVVEAGSYDVAIEVANGIDRVVRARFKASVEEPQGEECEVLYRKYTLEKEGRKGILHVKVRKLEECPPVDGNRCSVLEFDRDIHCIVDEIEECLA